MNITKCPHCGVKLGNFMDADACPHCHEELEHNQKRTLTATKADPRKERAWPFNLFTRFVRLVESSEGPSPKPRARSRWRWLPPAHKWIPARHLPAKNLGGGRPNSLPLSTRRVECALAQR